MKKIILWWGSKSLHFTKYSLRKQTDEIGGASSMHWQKELCIAFVWDTQTQRHNLEHPGLVGWITLQQIFKKQDGEHGLDWSGSGHWYVAGHYKQAEPLGFTKCGEIVG